MNVYVWSLGFIENCDSSSGPCMTTAFSKEEAVTKILTEFRRDKLKEIEKLVVSFGSERGSKYRKWAIPDLENIYLNLKEILETKEPRIFSLTEFVYPPQGDRCFE